MKSVKRLIKKIDDTYWAIYRGCRDYVFYPIWYRCFGHKFHIVKTKLTPQPWYDADARILYSVMEIVEWFVDNDQRIWTRKDVDEEVARIKTEEGEEYQADHIAVIENQYTEQEKIRSIANWWKEYHKREKEISDALSKWHKHTTDVAKREFKDYEEWDIVKFCKAKEKMTDVEKRQEEELSNKLHKMEEDLVNEEQEMLKKAIDLRFRMWS